MSQLGAIGWLFLVVAFGAIIPVIPTGAAVSGAAALAFHTQPLVIALAVARRRGRRLRRRPGHVRHLPGRR